MANRGVIITGGQVNAGNIVAGDGASAHYEANASPAELQALRGALQELLQEVRQANAPPAVQEATHQAVQEARQERPDKGRLSALLGTIGEGGKAVGAIASAATAVAGLVAALH